jgi:hypothetical protein
LHWLAERKLTSSVAQPAFSECCRAGEVDLPLLDPLPTDLQLLYEGQNHLVNDFQCHIHLYNKALAFTSTGGNQHLDGSSYGWSWSSTIQIHGEIFHRLGPLCPQGDTLPVFSQLYVYNHNEALAFRKRLNLQHDPTIMETLQTVLEQSHPLVDVHMQAYRLSQQTSLMEYQLQLNFRKGADRRRYNLPIANNELALIILGDEDTIANSQQILLCPYGGHLVRISPCDPSFLTLHFPLLMPTGQLGWQPGIPYVSSTPTSMCHVSLADYAKFHLHLRPPSLETGHFFQAGLLFRELLVHLWVAAKHTCLTWVRDNQKNFARSYTMVWSMLFTKGLTLQPLAKKWSYQPVSQVVRVSCNTTFRML